MLVKTDRERMEQMARGTIPVVADDWRPAPFVLGGGTVFAIGDVHGCAEELRALLDYRRAIVDYGRVQEAPATRGGSVVSTVNAGAVN